MPLKAFLLFLILKHIIRISSADPKRKPANKSLRAMPLKAFLLFLILKQASIKNNKKAFN